MRVCVPWVSTIPDVARAMLRAVPIGGLVVRAQLRRWGRLRWRTRGTSVIKACYRLGLSNGRRNGRLASMPVRPRKNETGAG